MKFNVDITKQPPVILSLCPGLRGIERGLERIFQSIRVAAYVEIETFIVENLLSAMESGLVDAAPVWTNLKTFNPEPFRNRIDGIIGGYPCQPFSLAGNRNGVEDPRHLFPYIESAIRTIRPFWCFFENVAGHVTMGFPEVSHRLRALGYRVEAGIYTAEEVGATHERERLFILAILADANGFGLWREHQSGFQPQTVRAGVKLANSDGKQRGLSESAQRNSCNETEWSDQKMEHSTCGRREQRKSPFGTLREFNQGCQELANTDNHGSDATQNGQSDSERSYGGETRPHQLFQSSGFGSTWLNDRFPAGQGEYQYDWEEPRTIESSVEYTINGYNFTEDLHRAIGNSVVEQTAELAFRDLFRKHFHN